MRWMLRVCPISEALESKRAETKLRLELEAENLINMCCWILLPHILLSFSTLWGQECITYFFFSYILLEIWKTRSYEQYTIYLNSIFISLLPTQKNLSFKFETISADLKNECICPHVGHLLCHNLQWDFVENN